MKIVIRYCTCFIFTFMAINLPAQNITGRWEGDLGFDQFLQLNIIQTGNKICGYTYDHVKNDKKSYCKAFFEGYYDVQQKKLVISGKYFLKNSGSHTLMNMSLNYKKEKGNEVLVARPDPSSMLSGLMSIFGIITDDPFREVDATQNVYIKKVSDQPSEMHELMQDCIARDKKKPDTAIVKKVVIKPKDSIPAPVVVAIPEKPKDSTPVVVNPVIVTADSIQIPKTLRQRKNVEQSNLEINVKSINLKVYDNAIVDGDTVSILYNGKMLLRHQLLSEKAIDINLELDESQTRHEITLFAENLGSIPPNTALIVITAGEKRYELFASASMEENAVLVFNYRPK